MKRPNWNEWKHTADVTVWQACALSMDMDPHSMNPRKQVIATNSGARREVDDVGPIFDPSDFPSPESKQEFERRQKVLWANLSNRILFPPDLGAQTPGVKQPGNFRVRLPEFVSWAMSIWDNLPAELAERAKAVPEVEEAPAQGSVEKPLGTTERNTLLTIIAALCDYSAIDPKGRGTATQIAKLTEEIGAPVSDDAVRKALAKLTDALETRKK